MAPHADSAAAVTQRLLAVQAENPSQAGWAGLYGARLDRATSLVVDSLSEQPDQTRAAPPIRGGEQLTATVR